MENQGVYWIFITVLDTIFEEGKANIRGMKLIDF